MMGRDIPHETAWPPTAPSELIGKRVYEVSERRLDNAWGMIEPKKVWTPRVGRPAAGSGARGSDLLRVLQDLCLVVMIPAKKTLFQCTGKKDKFTRIFL